jgi:hypothetical protein
MAYALVEEAFTTQSLFNPHYLKLNLGLLAPAYITALGIGAWWWMLMVHGIWSISTPIALIEACVPDRAHAVAGARRVGRSGNRVFVGSGCDDADGVQARSPYGFPGEVCRRGSCDCGVGGAGF